MKISFVNSVLQAQPKIRQFKANRQFKATQLASRKYTCTYTKMACNTTISLSHTLSVLVFWVGQWLKHTGDATEVWQCRWITFHSCLRWYTQNFLLYKHPNITCFSMVAEVKDVMCGKTEKNCCHNSGGLYHEVLFHSNEMLFSQMINVITFINIREKNNVWLIVILLWSLSRWSATLR